MATLERIISGTGEIALTQPFRDSLDIWLYVDVIRMPGNMYINKNWTPSRSDFAKITWLYQGYVQREDTLRYPRQMLQVFENQSSQNLLALICAYDGILDSFFELATCIAECVPISRTNLIKERQYKQYTVDRLQFKCYNDAALRLTLKSRRLEKCDNDDGRRRPPPPPPPPPVMVPPGTPVQDQGYDISPPLPDNIEGTQPNPLDEENADFPVGEECEIIGIRAVADAPILPMPIDVSTAVYGPLEGFTFNTDDGIVYGFDAIGRGDARFQQCGDGTLANFVTFGTSSPGDVLRVTIIDIERQNGDVFVPAVREYTQEV